MKGNRTQCGHYIVLKMVPDESSLSSKAVLYNHLWVYILYVWFLIKSCVTLPVSVNPRHLLQFSKCTYFWRGGLFYTNTPRVLLFRILIDILPSTLKISYLHKLFKKIITVCISSITRYLKFTLDIFECDCWI